MNRLFFRFFLLVMLSITLATFIIYGAISWLFGDPLEENAARQAAPQIFLLEQYIDKAPADEWLVRLNKVREVSHVKLDLIPLQQALTHLPAARHAALQSGAVVIDAGNKSFFRRVDLRGDKYVGSESDVVLAQDLPIDVALALKMEALRYVIVALALLIPIALWSRAHWQGLQDLSKVADAFGDGQLSARASIKKSASIYPLAERINSMAARIQTLLGAQQHLLHSVSHELRTPIARLEFGMELLRKTAKDQAMDTRIDAMQEDLTELNALVSELLSMAKLNQQHGLQSAPFQLATSVQICIQGLQHELAAHEVIVNLANDGTVINGEQHLLTRAIGNLLKNAAKYAERKIAISSSASADGGIDIVVEDDGPGIPAAEREHIFEPFYRLDRSRDRATGGFGLGLSIALQAVQQHGGRISVNASELGGARFVISLPGHTAGQSVGR
ncbi:MAG: ATP-binding protein [Undibacterium sp.]|nr:ATP-binding protein [Undibacterium sp.]